MLFCALKWEVDTGVVWDRWIGREMARTGVSGSIMYYRITKYNYIYYIAGGVT